MKTENLYALFALLLFIVCSSYVGSMEMADCIKTEFMYCEL